MSVLTINYKNIDTCIQYQSDEKLTDIFRRFKRKINAENKEIYYLYNIIDEDENITISQLTSDQEIKILAFDLNQTTIVHNNLVKSDYVICPSCKENAILEVKEYKLKIYGCEKEYIKDNILISQFNKLKEIDYSEIICQKCNKNNRSTTHNNQFYYCGECKINLCPFCKSLHSNHKIINYDDKLFICTMHNKEYHSYCNKCKKNLCTWCENNHKNNHNRNDLILLSDLIIEDDRIKKYMEEIKKEIELFNDNSSLSHKAPITQLGKTAFSNIIILSFSYFLTAFKILTTVAANFWQLWPEKL